MNPNLLVSELQATNHVSDTNGCHHPNNVVHSTPFTTLKRSATCTQQSRTAVKRTKLDEVKAKTKTQSTPTSLPPNPPHSQSGVVAHTPTLSDNQLDKYATLDDLSAVIVTRDKIEKEYRTPDFAEWITGNYVRFLIGSSGSQNCYRICQVIGVRPCSPGDGYVLGGTTVHTNLTLKHGRAVRTFPMRNISNAPPTASEFNRWKNQCLADKVELPKRRDLISLKASITRRIVADSSSKARPDFYNPLIEVSERNRKANLQAIRIAEVCRAQRKKRIRAAAKAQAASSKKALDSSGSDTSAPNPPSNILNFYSRLCQEMDIDLGDF